MAAVLFLEATQLATDRQHWRTYIRLSQRAPASPWQQEETEREREYIKFSPVQWLVAQKFNECIIKLEFLCYLQLYNYDSDYYEYYS